MSAATEGKLGALHDKLATIMGTALDIIGTKQELYKLALESAIEQQSFEDMPAAEPEVSPAMLSVVERFLANNKITCVPEAGNAMGELERKLAEKREKRAKRSVGNVVHLHDEAV